MQLIAAMIALHASSAPTEIEQKIGKIVAASTSRPDFERLVQDLLDELALGLSEAEVARMTPVSVEQISTSPNLSPETRTRLGFLLSAALRKVPKLEEVQCLACAGKITPHMAPDGLSLSVGNVDRDGMRARAEEAGAKSMMFVALEWIENGTKRDKLSLSASVVATATGEIVWARRIDSDEDRASLERDRKKLETVQAREAELAQHWRYLPSFGIGFLLGLTQIPYRLIGGDSGNINGLSIGLRLHEVFGPNREIVVGLQGLAFIDPASTLPLSRRPPVAGGIATLYGGYTLKFTDHRLPTFRGTVHAGGYLAGSLGNSFAVGGMLEAQMRFRLGLNFSLLYILPVNLMETLMIPLEVGGLTWFFGTSFTWD